MSTAYPLTWEEVYADWKTDDLKYYWKDLVTQVSTWDTSYSERGFKEGLDLAKQGDSRAILLMKRAVLRQPDSENGKAAAKVLKEIDA